MLYGLSVSGIIAYLFLLVIKQASLAIWAISYTVLLSLMMLYMTLSMTSQIV